MIHVHLHDGAIAQLFLALLDHGAGRAFATLAQTYTEVEQSEVVASGSARSEDGARGGGSVRCVHSCSDKDATQHPYGMGWCGF